MRRLFLSVFFHAVTIAFFLGTPNTGYSLYAVDRSFEELVDLSETILIGRVTHIDAERIGGHIYSFIDFDISEVLKGKPQNNTYRVRQLGGTIAPVTEKVIGGPEFKIEQKYMLFIKDNNKAIFPFVGVKQGIYKIVGDGNGNEFAFSLNRPLPPAGSARFAAGANAGVALPEIRGKVLQRLGKQP